MVEFQVCRDAPEPTGEEGEDADAELPKVYEPVNNEKELFDRFEMFLSQFNEMVRGSGMDLVFFPDAMLHLVKISRVLRHPRGNMMLVGSSDRIHTTPMVSNESFRRGWKRQTIPHQTSFFHCWLQSISDYVNAIVQHCQFHGRPEGALQDLWLSSQRNHFHFHRFGC